jgi:ribose 5-phosphate isomerase A
MTRAAGARRSAPATAAQEMEKRAAAERAAGLVRPGMIVGLGSGTTAGFVLGYLAARLGRGELPEVVGIPTSTTVEVKGRRLGIPLTDLQAHPVIDLTIDGADEVDPGWNLIKGGGGALLREKIVAQASRREVIVVDHTKWSPRLGTRHADADLGPIDDPATLAGRLLARAGVAEVGLFCGLTSDLIIATRTGVEHRTSHDKEQR